MNLKVPGAISTLGCTFLSTGAKTVLGVVATPLSENYRFSNACSVQKVKARNFERALQRRV